MTKAAGTIFFSLDTRRILMNYRSNTVSCPCTWGFWGGKIEKGEKILSGLSREIKEEMGFVPKYEKVYPIDIFRTKDNAFYYYSFIVVVKKEFAPKINHESGGWGWFDLDCLPKPLHPGAHAVFKLIDINQNIDNIVKDFD